MLSVSRSTMYMHIMTYTYMYMYMCISSTLNVYTLINALELKSWYK